ncbi:hypothetical protein BJY00DRAFT_320300 [Aspergillus carlsbadensis]|nr:hypothetical protein BJY00DRAFT_320300 [Aspergillus carlsbadensis]
MVTNGNYPPWFLTMVAVGIVLEIKEATNTQEKINAPALRKRFLTATPLLNQIIDLCGPLALLNTTKINVRARDALAKAGGNPLKVYKEAQPLHIGTTWEH